MKVADSDTKDQPPVHIIFGSGEYAGIKMETKPQVGDKDKPIADLTKMEWFIMSPGTVFDRNTMLYSQTSQSDYEELCRMDVLGLADASHSDQRFVHEEFKEQSYRDKEGCYETGLPWHANHPALPNNKQGSIRLTTLEKNFQHRDPTSAYDEVIQGQVLENIVERAPPEISGNEFYIPHMPVVRETATTTRLRIVYDASARASHDSPSLNDCLKWNKQRDTLSIVVPKEELQPTKQGILGRLARIYDPNLVPLARDPLGRGTKGPGIIHLFFPQILEIRYYCTCAKFFKMEGMRTEIDTIF